MATNDIKFKVIATADGFDIVQKKQKGLADQIDKTNKSTKQLDKTQEKNYGRQKQGLIQTANGTKNFSKLSQTIGSGSSGLVGAYATLAANVFAATAAFNAFRQAAAFEQLVEGFTFMANESGRTTSIVVDRLKEITGEALSTQEALQGASLALSAGFSSTDLEGLAKVARGASLALGRNLNDAFDRLTRGAIKLEPEILDELGIMVRLDDATEAYANTLGKTANQLTQFQRQQAFLNAINEQGAKKYGDIAEAIDVNPYDRLAAAFTDLTKAGLTSLNTVLIPIAELFAGSGSVMIGGLVLFGSTILTSMIPALGQMSQRAQEAAEHQHSVATALNESADESVVASRNQILAIEKPSRAMRKFQGELKKNAVTQQQISKQIVLAEKRKATQQKIIDQTDKKYTANQIANAEKRKLAIQAEIDSLNDLKGASSQAREALPLLGQAGSQVDMADRTSSGLSAINQAGPLGGFKEANKQFKDFRKNADTSTASMTIMGKTFPRVGRAAKLSSVGLKFFGSALLNMIPFIGQLIFAFGLLSSAFSFLKKKIDPPIKSLDGFGEMVDSLPEKMEQLAKALTKSGITAGEIGIKKYKVTAGILQELASQAQLATDEINKLAQAEIDRKVGANKNLFGEAAAAAIDNIDSEKIQDRFGRKAGKKLQTEIIKVFKETGAESQLLRDTIIKEANKFGINGAQIIDPKTGKLPADASLITRILKAASDSISNINGELVSLQKQVADNERVFGKFFQQFEKKTKFDDALASFSAMRTTIQELDAASKEAEIEAILADMGAQAKRFGLTADNARDKLKTLEEAFKTMQTNAINLQSALKKLDSEIKVLKKFEGISTLAARTLLNLQEQRIQKEIDANNIQLTTLEGMKEAAKTKEEEQSLQLQINDLTNKNATLENSRLSTAMQENKIKELNIKLELDNFKIQEKISNLQLSRLKTQEKFNLALKGQASSPGQNFTREISNARTVSKLTKDRLIIEERLIKAKINFQKAEIAHALAMGKISLPMYEEGINALNEQLRLQSKLFSQQSAAAEDPAKNLISDALLSGDIEAGILALGELSEEERTVAVRAKIASTEFTKLGESIGTMNEGFGQAIGNIVMMSEQILGLQDRITELANVFNTADNKGGLFSALGLNNVEAAKAIAVAEIVSSALNAFGAAQQGFAQSRVKEIDNLIAAEKRMDGKSKESLAKIAQMEAKKLAIQKKAFEQDKKIKIATAIISTATAAAMAYAAAPGLLGIALASAITALGLAQVALIKKTTFQGGSSADAGAKPPSEINVGGQRNNRVDVSQTASAGETAFLRGESGVGSNANTFTPGGAMGRKGYADGGMLVGERGPEVVTKEEIIPNYALGGNKSMNLTFNVSALDGASVQEVLTNNQGAVVGAIRDAANSYGQDFLPDVNVGYGGDG